MQFLALLDRWIYTAIISAPIVLSASFYLERALFDVAPDDSLFSNELNLDDFNSWNQDVGLDTNGFLAGNALDPITEFDSNQSLAENDIVDEWASNFLLADNDVACGLDGAEDTQLFGKVRRENVCRDPQVGQAKKPDEPIQNPFDAYKKLITITEPLAPFPPDTETCSKRRFDTSNIPVCKDEFPPEDLLPVPRTRAFNLRNIDPSAAMSP